MIEVELKFQINNLGDVTKKLSGLNARITKPRTYELSVMFDNPGELMQVTDGRIRVRQTGETVEFCYKKPVTREGIKKEIEHEVTVSDYKNLHHILTEMDFHETTSYERFRTEYFYDDLKITIDEYPFANILEIEGEENDIVVFAEKLGLKISDNITDSCDTLFTKWRGERGLVPISHMKFDSFNK